jgi:hypothetical protein
MNSFFVYGAGAFEKEKDESILHGEMFWEGKFAGSRKPRETAIHNRMLSDSCTSTISVQRNAMTWMNRNERLKQIERACKSIRRFQIMIASEGLCCGDRSVLS